MTCKCFRYACNKKYMQGMVSRHDGISYLLKVIFCVIVVSFYRIKFICLRRTKFCSINLFTIIEVKF